MSKKLSLSIFYLLGIVFLLPTSTYAQNTDAAKQLDPRELDEYKEHAKYIVSSLENYFNIVGDSSSAFSDKKVIFNESWQKLFRDNKVQVEDDLDPNRKHTIYKDITAYLKDIDFFFKHADFEFELKEIQSLINDQGDLFLKVDLYQNLNAIDIDGDTLHTEGDRFLEISVDREEQDLKVVSIYSNKINEDFNLLQWWQNLSQSWQVYFGKNVLIKDSIYLSGLIADKDSTDYSSDILWVNPSPDSLFGIDTLYFTDDLIQRQIRSITVSESLSISGDTSLNELSALRVFSNLRQLDISNTKIQDLSPIRHLTDLNYLNASYTLVNDITPLQYNSGLKHLNLSFSMIEQLEILHRFINLEQLDLSNTRPASLKGIENLSMLKELGLNNMELTQEDYKKIQHLSSLDYLKLANSNIMNLAPVGKLKKLTRLDIRSTHITDITPLAGCESLKTLNMEGAPLSSLLPLLVLTNIEKIYCDNTRISKKLAYDFMNKKPGTLVVHNSSYLFNWWQSLSDEWKQILAPELSGKPGKEALQEIASIEKIDIAGRKDIQSIEALSILENLNYLDISNTSVSDLAPISELENIKHIDFSNTSVSSLTPLMLSEKLEIIKMEGTPASRLSALNGKALLRVVYADSSAIKQEAIDSLVINNKGGLIVIHNVDYYRSWWVNLEDRWKEILSEPLSISTEPGELDLFRIIFQKELSIVGNRSLTYLEPLKKLRYLQSLEISQTAVKDLKPLSKLHYLKKLKFTDAPIENINGITGLHKLEYLNVSNTPVDDLSALEVLPNVKHLIISGTEIKNLKSLSELRNLEILDCSNTSLRNLRPIEELKSLRSITCYNTRISDRYIDDFKIEHQGVKVIYY